MIRHDKSILIIQFNTYRKTNDKTYISLIILNKTTFSLFCELYLIFKLSVNKQNIIMQLLTF